MAKKKAAKKKRGTGKSPAKTKPKAKKRRRPVDQAIRDHANALRELGASNVKRGSKLLGETDWLTPTGRVMGRGIANSGFAAVDRALGAIRKVPPPALFSFDLIVRFRGLSGKIEQNVMSNIGVPLQSRSRAELSLKVRSIIHDAIFKGVINQAFGKYPAEATTGAMTPAQFAATVRSIKEQRNIKFKVRFYREVVHAEETPPMDRRPGLGRRRQGKPVPVRNRQPVGRVARPDQGKNARSPARPGKKVQGKKRS
jgi:hypothetical protein